MFKTNYKPKYTPLQNCEHEFIVAESGINPERTRISLRLIVRNDVDQPDKDRVFFHSIYQKREPNELDAQCDNFSYAAICNISEAAELPEDTEFDTLDRWIATLPGCTLRATLKTETYNGKEYQRCGFFDPTNYPKIAHEWKGEQAPAKTDAQGFTEANDDELPF